MQRIVAHRGWRETRERALSALGRGARWVAVLSPAGTGKTLLLQELAHLLRSRGVASELVVRGDLVIDSPAGAIMLIDEAGRMDVATLDRLDQGPGAGYIVADLPILAERLRELAGSVEIVAIAPLAPDEVGGFLAARLMAAGYASDVFAGTATERLASESAGIPRVIDRLAGMALFLAGMDGSERVEAHHIEAAVAFRDGEKPIDASAAVSATPAAAADADAAAVTAVPVTDVPVTDVPVTDVRARARKVRPQRSVILGAMAVGGAAAVIASLVLFRHPAPEPRPVAMVASAAIHPPLTIPPVRASARGVRRTRALAAPTPPHSPKLGDRPGLIVLDAAAAPIADARPAPDRASPTKTAQAKAAPAKMAPVAGNAAIARASPAITSALPPAAAQTRLATLDAPLPPAPAVPRVAEPALPAAATARVVLAYPVRSEPAQRLAAALALALRADGLDVEDPISAASGSRPSIRYFFVEDQATAERVAAAAHQLIAGFAGAPELFGARRGDALAPPGTVEISVPEQRGE